MISIKKDIPEESDCDKNLTSYANNTLQDSCQFIRKMYRKTIESEWVWLNTLQNLSM